MAFTSLHNNPAILIVHTPIKVDFIKFHPIPSHPIPFQCSEEMGAGRFNTMQRGMEEEGNGLVGQEHS